MDARRAGLSALFQALGDPTRRQLLDALGDGPRRMSDLAAPLPMTLAAVSKHLRVLERAGLVHRARQGREHHFEVRAQGLDEIEQWIATQRAAWSDRLRALESVLEDVASDQVAAPKRPDTPEPARAAGKPKKERRR